MKQSLISIIIPNYNRVHLIGATLDSIILQTYTNWECIVIDDGSTDGSFDEVTTYALRDSRIKQFKRPSTYTKGACSCRNYGFKLSTGTFINWFDSDDLMKSDKLEKQLKKFENKTLNLVVCQTQFFEGNIGDLKQFWNSSFTSIFDPLTDFITFRLAWSTNAPLWRRSFLENKNLFNESLSSSQDWEFHSRILTNISRMEVLSETLVFNRLHEGRIGLNSVLARSKTRLNSRMFIFDFLHERNMLNKELKKYFRSFFMNQLKFISEKGVNWELLNSIKSNTNSIRWWFNFYPRILIYLFVFKIFGKKQLLYKYLIKQAINDNRK